MGLKRLPIGSFGAITGAAAALIGAAERPTVARAVVSRGGRPDLAGRALAQVKAPTLLIVDSPRTCGPNSSVHRMRAERSADGRHVIAARSAHWI